MINTAIATLDALSIFQILGSSDSFNPLIPVKYWADPAPNLMDFGGEKIALYHSFKIDPASNKVVKFSFAVPELQARFANIPFKTWTGSVSVLTTPTACRDLELGESFRVGFGNVIQVINDALYAQLSAASPTSSSGFTQEDRDVLNTLFSAKNPLLDLTPITARLTSIETILSQIAITLSIKQGN